MIFNELIRPLFFSPDRKSKTCLDEGLTLKRLYDKITLGETRRQNFGEISKECYLSYNTLCEEFTNQ